MSDIVIFKLNQQPQYLKSVNTGDYINDPDILINPDISSVQSVPLKYWKRSGDSIVEMSTSEKSAIDLEELNQRKATADNFNISVEMLANVLLDLFADKFTAKNITKDYLVNLIKKRIV